MDFPYAHVFWTLAVFVLGLNVGSFLNVVVGRLQFEKSILWPNSRCLSCLRPLSFLDNLPLIGWLRARGRCRQCGAPFSSRYLWVELACGLAFAGLFWFDVVANGHRLKVFEYNDSQLTSTGLPPWQSVVFFLHHALLFSFLLAAALCDWDRREIPMSLTVCGTLVGLLIAVCFPWPFPSPRSMTDYLNTQKQTAGVFHDRSWSFHANAGEVPTGQYPWPVWGPMPSWLSDNPWLLGLLTGLAGAAAGMILIRAVKFTFEQGLGKEAMGLGDADLMMMAGAFIGWQPVVVAFFVGTVVSLPIGIVFRIVQKDKEGFPFGPGLALGVAITVMCWRTIGPPLQLHLFEEMLVLLALGVLVGGLFIGSIVLRVAGFGQAKHVK